MVFENDLDDDTIEAIIAGPSHEDRCMLPIWLSLDPPEDVDVEALCVRLAHHEHPNVRGNAILGFGHLARVTGELNREIVVPLVEAALKDEDAYVRGHADDAASDIQHFLGWKIKR
ncbi:hypothetical protein [Gimibacter soli]|uniref:HEAT repeat domain-containing protein n=1 Tax=Gimibacter soli TaxID=3024400 RepID=A0AAE9XN96_9PROT|nr:hypothetical protein [Gimibacter soli]WCL54132.1 hypothetical protein PH603_16460 [Gimibacter soli]